MRQGAVLRYPWDPPQREGPARQAAKNRRPPLLAPGDLRDELGHVVGLLALNDPGGHIALPQAALLRVGRRWALEAAVFDRVQHQRRAGLDRVEVRSDLADGVRGG